MGFPAKKSHPFLISLIVLILLFGLLVPSAMAALDIWTKMSPASKPSGRQYHGMASIGDDKALLFGGDYGAKDDETWVYDLSAHSWTQYNTTGTRPSARSGHGMAYIADEQVLLFGGDTDNYNDETWVYDLSAHSWTQYNTTGTRPSARLGSGLAYIGGDQVLLFGGYYGADEDDETWVYDLSAHSWTQYNTTGTRPSHRAHSAMANIGGDQVVLFGGYDGTRDDETWVYDLSDHSWTQKSPTTKPSARSSHAMANVGDQVLLFGGLDGSGRDDETWVYNFITADLEVSEAVDSGNSSYRTAIDNSGGRFAWGKSLVILPSGLIPNGFSNCRLIREVQEGSNIASGFSSGDAIFDIYILCDEGRLSTLNQAITICLRPRDGNSMNKEIFHQHGNRDSYTALPSASGPAGYVCGSTSQLSNFTVDKLSLPNTGFAPGLISEIGNQPQDKTYASTSLTLEIPKLGLEMPIVAVPLTAGGWDTTWLNGQAGYMQTTSFPTFAGNSVLTGHVWDANNNPGPFAKLKELQHGDQFSIHAWGLEYVYEVRGSRLVSSWNLSVLGETELDWVTLITCERFNEASNSYLYRRAVQAVLVSVD